MWENLGEQASRQMEKAYSFVEKKITPLWFKEHNRLQVAASCCTRHSCLRPVCPPQVLASATPGLQSSRVCLWHLSYLSASSRFFEDHPSSFFLYPSPLVPWSTSYGTINQRCFDTLTWQAIKSNKIFEDGKCIYWALAVCLVLF